jgi:hypothetical protein
MWFICQHESGKADLSVHQRMMLRQSSKHWWFWSLLISADFCFFTSATSWIAWMWYLYILCNINIYLYYMIGLWEHLQETMFFFCAMKYGSFMKFPLTNPFIWDWKCAIPPTSGVDKFSEFMMINQWIFGVFPGSFFRQIQSWRFPKVGVPSGNLT